MHDVFDDESLDSRRQRSSCMHTTTLNVTSVHRMHCDEAVRNDYMGEYLDDLELYIER